MATILKNKSHRFSHIFKNLDGKHIFLLVLY